MRVLWLLRAAEDMEHLIDYVAADKPASAASEAERVLKAVRQLSAHPASGRPGRVYGTRELVVEPYIVAYRVKDDAIQILRVLHSAQRWPKRLG